MLLTIIFTIGAALLLLSYMYGRLKTKMKQSQSQLAKKDKGLADARKNSDRIKYDGRHRERLRKRFR